ncbi:hypothetical protein LCGC14_1823780, partial [marine sediment metagenome]
MYLYYTLSNDACIRMCSLLAETHGDLRYLAVYFNNEVQARDCLYCRFFILVFLFQSACFVNKQMLYVSYYNNKGVNNMRKLISLLAITLMFIAAASGVYAHQMIGITGASVTPTVAAPGDPLLVSFDYDTNHWNHSLPNTPWTKDGWRLLWDGVMPSIASGLGPGSHPVDNVVKTYSVNTTINVP